MSMYLFVYKLTQEWTKKWTPMLHIASASRRNKLQLFFLDITVVAILHVVSSIDFTNMKII